MAKPEISTLLNKNTNSNVERKPSQVLKVLRGFRNIKAVLTSIFGIVTLAATITLAVEAKKASCDSLRDENYDYFLCSLKPTVLQLEKLLADIFTKPIFWSLTVGFMLIAIALVFCTLKVSGYTIGKTKKKLTVSEEV